MNENLKRKVIDDVSIQEMHHMRNDELMSNYDIAQAIGCTETTVYNYLGKQPNHIRKKYTKRDKPLVDARDYTRKENEINPADGINNLHSEAVGPDRTTAGSVKLPYKSERVAETFKFNSECVRSATVNWEQRTIRLDANGGIGYYPLVFEEVAEVASVLYAVLQYATENDAKETNND